MNNDEKITITSDIPDQIILGFLDQLSKDGIPLGVVKELRGTLLAEESITENLIKDALFPEDKMR